MWGNSLRPRYCLKIGARVLAWGEHSRTWRGRHRFHSVLSPIPAKSIKLSPIDLNVIDQAAVEERIRSLAGPASRLSIVGRQFLASLPRPIVLVLPDLSVRTAVIPFDQLPSRIEEREALIRWRLGQEQRLPLAGVKLIWQVFPSLPSDPASHHMVLVISIHESILAQYESACESAGLLPQEVGVNSFHLFNLWLRAVGRSRLLSQDLAWLTVMDGGFTCFIIHQGRPVFVRTKLLPSDNQSEENVSEDLREKIVHEIAASFLACQESHPAVQVKLMALATDDGLPGLEEALSNEFEVAVDRLEWNHAEALGWSHKGGSTSKAALPAVAGMI